MLIMKDHMMSTRKAKFEASMLLATYVLKRVVRVPSSQYVDYQFTQTYLP
jgi:hypothetical protein